MVSIKWVETNRRDQLVGKVKDFKTKEQLDKFIDKLVEKDNFIRIEAISK